jgi:DNA-binding response OmpR family regulator
VADPPVVLVVEDDRAVRDLLAALLEGAGLVVHTARDGLEGLLKTKVHRPAAIVLDIMMPDVGGLRLLDQLADEHADVPVVVVTGKPDAAQEARTRLGAANVFTKPFDIDDVLARVLAVVERP